MTQIEQDILASLVALDEAVKSMRSSGAKPDLLPIFARLDRLSQELPENADPNLLHYLQQKSYEKARLLLQGDGSENARGSCGSS